VENPYPRRPHTPRFADGIVRVAIRDDDDLVCRIKLVELVQQARDVLIDSLALAIGGDDDGQSDWGPSLRSWCRNGLLGSRFPHVESHLSTPS
jgi:hypothetical protein